MMMRMMMMIPTTTVSKTYSSLSFRFVVQMIALVIPLLLPSSSSSKTTTVQVTALFTTDEQTYLKIPNATLAKSSLHFLTRIPHVAGTEGDQLMAEFVHHEFMNAGIPIVDIDRLVAKLNYPNFESVHQPTASLSLWEITNTSDDEEEEDMIVESSLHFLTRIPHVAGTEGDQLLAEFVQNEFINAGIPTVEIDRVVAKVNYP
eukprot:CAMPEP_0171009530 /NCGR_PEP_ID=MMETSP0736-20130129/21361_1 /TAXON_ID=186038 /ORGANISM="Fragilariopsis kerguelensis, Strain L26-C5" /LENGTH=202 /DNA_ID=CAMNT_0011441131 /DNA_START=271 /DNA_END=875 /DNA_ORIENTATION=+